HLAAVAYPEGSDTMSLLHLEWDGQSWAMPEIIVNSPPFPEYPRMAIGQGNRLHLVWFDGDRASIDRTPVGVRYSSAQLTTPAVAAVRPAPNANSAKPPTEATPVGAPVSPVVGSPHGSDSAQEGTGSGPPGWREWVSDPEQRQVYPLVAGIGAALVLLGMMAVAKAGTARLSGRDPRREG
ncbi:MAG TPA: hypothetical protein VHS06_11140, partial [Chloroflexota bacterium]|nr:hypothetical protein [Chloroflexota bacterium]